MSTPIATIKAYRRKDPAVPAALEIISTAVRMPEPGRAVLMWEVEAARWAIGSWCPRFRQWSNRDDPEYAIHPEQVSHWMLLPELLP